MPKGHYDRSGIDFRRKTYTGRRPWENTDAQPCEIVSDVTRGDIRLAAEVTLTKANGHHVPSFAQARAERTMAVLARD